MAYHIKKTKRVISIKFDGVGACFFFPLAVNITPINMTLCILEKNKIKSALRALRSC